MWEDEVASRGRCGTPQEVTWPELRAGGLVMGRGGAATAQSEAGRAESHSSACPTPKPGFSLPHHLSIHSAVSY